MSIIDLTSDLSAGAGDNLSQHGGRHGGLSNETPSMPAHSIEHSQLDTGVGNSSNAQSFNDGHGYTVTGNKEFDRPNESALANMLEAVGSQVHPTGEGIQTGPVNYFSGVTGEWGPGTLPAGFTFNMAYGDSKLAPNDTMALSTTRHTVGLDTLEPIIFAAPNAYDSDFMTTPIANNISNLQGFSDSLTHNVSMITLTGPTAGETYQTAINTTPSTLGAHGSDFMTTPIASYISRYAPPIETSVTNPDIVYDTPAITLPISYAKTRAAFNHHTAIPFADSVQYMTGDIADTGVPISYEKTDRTFFDHYPEVDFEDSLHWIEGDVNLAAHNPTTIRARQLSRIATAPVWSTTKDAINTSFVDGKQPTFHIPKQYSFVGNYGLQTRILTDSDENIDWAGTYLPNKASTKPTSTLQFASLFGPIKDSRFKTGDAINMTFTDIFGHAYEALSSLNSNIALPTKEDTPSPTDSWFKTFSIGKSYTKTYKRRSRIQYFDTSTTLTMEPYTRNFQLGKQNENSPKFLNTGFYRGEAYSPSVAKIGEGSSITNNTRGDQSRLKDLHKDSWGNDDATNLDNYYGRGFKDGDELNYRIGDGHNDIGFNQPFYLHDIGDKYGLGNTGAFDEGIVRGGLITSISRTIADVFRIGKFILSTKGVLFGIKQVALQTLNTKEETRTWNPLSLGSITPTVHINRHWNTGSPLVSSTVLEFEAANPLDTKLVDWGENSLNYHFRKEEAIIDNPGTNPLLSKLGSLLGNNAEASREIDRIRKDQFGDDEKFAVIDVGDQSNAGILRQFTDGSETTGDGFFFRPETFNAGLKKAGFSHIKADLGSSKLMTSKVDKVNALPYGSVNGKEPKEINNLEVRDFIPFKFKDVVNNKWIIFRAILSGISDSVTPDWSEEKYIGRPDKVYTYAGVDREISFNFNVYPKTKQELPILWEKMNYLIGMCYPSWKDFSNSDMERMVSPFAELTIGNMWTGAPGFLTSLSITVEDNTTWELDDHFKLPKHLSVSVGYKYIGKHKPAQKGKHYDLDWLDYKNNNNKSSTAYLDNPNGNYPDRHSDGMDLRELFAEMGQSGKGDGPFSWSDPSWED